MDPNRTDILNQLASGQISADEAAQRLGPRPATPRPSPAFDSKRWLHVRVTNLATGRPQVNVNLPLSWVEVGLKIGAKYQPEIAGLDLNDLVEQIYAGANGKVVEVEDLEDGQRVEIFVD
jgi:hypothetical protein